MAILNKRKLPLLGVVMRLGKLSNEDVAEMAGVSTRTVSEARRKSGKPIRSDFAGFIEVAVFKMVTK